MPPPTTTTRSGAMWGGLAHGTILAGDGRAAIGVSCPLGIRGGYGAGPRGASSRSGSVSATVVPAAVAPLDAQAAAADLGALAHPGDPVAARALAPRTRSNPRPSSRTRSSSAAAVARSVEPHACRRRVLDDVRQRLLGDAVGDRLDLGVEAALPELAGRARARRPCAAPTRSASVRSAGSRPSSSSAGGRRSAMMPRSAAISCSSCATAALDLRARRRPGRRAARPTAPASSPRAPAASRRAGRAPSAGARPPRRRSSRAGAAPRRCAPSRRRSPRWRRRTAARARRRRRTSRPGRCGRRRRARRSRARGRRAARAARCARRRARTAPGRR